MGKEASKNGFGGTSYLFILFFGRNSALLCLTLLVLNPLLPALQSQEVFVFLLSWTAVAAAFNIS